MSRQKGILPFFRLSRFGGLMYLLVSSHCRNNVVVILVRDIAGGLDLCGKRGKPLHGNTVAHKIVQGIHDNCLVHAQTVRTVSDIRSARYLILDFRDALYNRKCSGQLGYSAERASD